MLVFTFHDGTVHFMTTVSKQICLLILLLSSTSIMANATNFDHALFLKHGPYQQGTVKINRTKLQTVVTWCSPSLLEMQVYPGINNDYPTHYQKLEGHNHPLQIAIAVFTPTLPFEYAKNYHLANYVTSTCDPAGIQTHLSASTTPSVKFKTPIGQTLSTQGKNMAVINVNCTQGKIGLYETGQFKGPTYGQTGGVVLVPSGSQSKVEATCQSNGFSIHIT